MAPSYDDYKGDGLLATAIVCTALSLLSFIGRLWGKFLSAARWGPDDVLMVFVMLGCWSITAINLLGLHYGAGRHIEFLPYPMIRNYIITVFVFFILQNTTTLLIKFAVLTLYWRTFPTSKMRTAIKVVSGIIIANHAGIYIAVCRFCTPIEHFWDPLTVPGHCVNRSLANTLFSSTLLITELILYVMPIPIIWKLKMTRRRRIEIMLVFTIGLFVCLTRIAQLVDSIRLDYNDPTWSNVDVAIWNIIESHIGAVTANIVLMGPVISLFSKRLQHYLMPATSRQKMVNPGSSSYTLSSYKRSEHRFKRMDDMALGVFTPTIEQGPSQADQRLSDTAQSEYDGVKVKTDLEQNSGFRASDRDEVSMS